MSKIHECGRSELVYHPAMPRIFSLAHLTALTLPPPELIGVAARSGYQRVGLRVLRVTPQGLAYPLMDDPPGLRETKAALADTGLSVNDIELVQITPEIDIAALESFIAVGAELGATHVLSAPYDPDPARLTDRFGALCDLAGKYGLSVVLEFFPWTDTKNLAADLAIVTASARKNAGVLVDTLHFDRSGGSLDELRQVPPALLPFAHVCDAPAEKPATREAMLHTARAERLPPGEGGIDIRGIVAALPPGIPIALEVPMESLAREIGPEAVARRVREAAGRVLGEA
jgi:sugar phosphate isomerase/epimerase